ncbi:MAG: hypothetical protein MZW92_57650 [Comamonadaceae bacterium]|nr:hypothetical protein [Comamonadaceae bacterium]
MAGDLPADFDAQRAAGAVDALAAQRRRRGHAQGLAAGAGRAGAARCPSCFGGSADLTGSQPDRLQGLRARPAATGPATTCSYGVREFGMAAMHERHGAARRLHPLRRHLPDLQRLQPQRASAWPR